MTKYKITVRECEREAECPKLAGEFSTYNAARKALLDFTSVYGVSRESVAKYLKKYGCVEMSLGPAIFWKYEIVEAE